MTEPAPPAASCRYCRLGVCLYEETLNPGRDVGRQCALLVRLMRDWDDFLDRAEAFGLDERAAARLWTGRQRVVEPAAAGCPAVAGVRSKEAAAAKLPEECPFLWKGLCIKALPACSGKCVFFQHLVATDDAERLP